MMAPQDSERVLLSRLQDTLATVAHERRTTWISIGMILLGVFVVLSSVIYSAYSLRGVQTELEAKSKEMGELQAQIMGRRTEINLLESQINDLNKKNIGLKEALPIGFIGKYAIQLESDESLVDAKRNVLDKGKANGFSSVYVFRLVNKDDPFKTVAVFDSYESAKQSVPMALKANPTSGDIKDFTEYCPRSVWNEDGGYFDCDPSVEQVEQDAFNLLIQKNLPASAERFAWAERISPGYHNVAKINRLLKSSESLWSVADDAKREAVWKETSLKILTDYSQEMPLDVKQQLELQIK